MKPCSRISTLERSEQAKEDEDLKSSILLKTNQMLKQVMITELAFKQAALVLNH